MKTIPLFLSSLLLTTVAPLRAQAPDTGKDIESVGSMELAQRFLDRSRAVPDCSFRYQVSTCVPTSMEELQSLMQLQSSIPNEEFARRTAALPTTNRIEEIEFVQFAGSFSISTFERGSLVRRITFHDGYYYYLIGGDRGRRLYTGRDATFYKKVVSAGLLTTPLYVACEPLVPGDAHFSRSYADTLNFWTEICKNVRLVSKQGDRVDLERKISDTVSVSLQYDSKRGITESKEIDRGRLIGGVKVLEAKSFPGNQVLPVNYVIGPQGPEGDLQFGAAKYTMDTASFKLLTEAPKDGFTIPSVGAEELYDTDIGTLMRRK